MVNKKSLRICRQGHRYYKGSDCPVCPVCASEEKPEEGFLSKLAAPARRAISGAGITSVEELSKFTLAEIKRLHGLGPSSIPKLEQALKEKGLGFRIE